MARTTSWWKARRVKHRDALLLCILSSAFLLAGELTTNPVLAYVYSQYLAPYFDEPLVLVYNTALAGLAFTTAFGAVLVLVGAAYFVQARIARGRFFVGLGIGLTSLSLASRIAYATLVEGTPLAFLVPLAKSPTGVGILLGVAAHTVMGQYALLLKKHARQAWRRWRRARRAPRRA